MLGRSHEAPAHQLVARCARTMHSSQQLAPPHECADFESGRGRGWGAGQRRGAYSGDEALSTSREYAATTAVRKLQRLAAEKKLRRAALDQFAEVLGRLVALLNRVDSLIAGVE